MRSYHNILFSATLFIFLFVSVFSFYKNEHSQEDDSSISIFLDSEESDKIPLKTDDYWFHSSSCNENANSAWDGSLWSLKISNISKKTKCNLRFQKEIAISLDANGGTFENNITTQNVSINKKLVNEQINSIKKPSLNRYSFLKYNTKKDGTGIDLSYESLLEGHTSYFAVYKQTIAIVSFDSGNLLMDYDNNWINSVSTIVTNGNFSSSGIHFTTKAEYQSNSFYLLLNDTTVSSSYLELITSKIGENLYTFSKESGMYKIQSRLNGSKIDIFRYDEYYFTKGKTYSIFYEYAPTDALTWKIINFSMKEVINPVNINVGSKVSKPSTTLYKPGYKIGENWYTDEARTNLYDFNSPVTKDITLYPGFQKQ